MNSKPIYMQARVLETSVHITCAEPFSIEGLADTLREVIVRSLPPGVGVGRLALEFRPAKDGDPKP